MTKKLKDKMTFLAAFLIVAAAAVLLEGGQALAATTPAAGAFAYDIYDIAVNKILNGPIGFVAGVGAIGYGGYQAWMGNGWGAILPILGGATILSADTIVTSLGAVI